MDPFPGSAGAPARIRLDLGGAVLALAVLGGVAFGSGATEPRVTARMLLLDGTIVGSDVVAVGERGTILRSPDQGVAWHRVASPTRATLTGVSFATLTAPRLGWAVGHDAIILATTDGGRTWIRQFQGDKLEDSFLDVLAVDAQRVIAVGAYGLAMVTTNGGTTWERRKFTDDDTHFNRITRGHAGSLYLAGERGTLLRSVNSGDSWQAINAPYEGSFYGVLPLDRHTLLAYGLRGHAYYSSDEGGSWRLVPTPDPVLLATALRLKSGPIVLAGQARALVVSRDDGRSLAPLAGALATGVAELLELPAGNLLALGEAGATVLPKP